MLSPRSLRSSLLAVPRRALFFGALSFALVTALALPVSAQVTGQAPAPAPSSSSDVQTAQVVEKTSPLEKRDVALSIFAQDTNKTNGNFVRIDPTTSGGGMVSFRQSPRLWFGYELNYGTTKYSNTYDKGGYRVKSQANEITAAYLIKLPVYFGVRAFTSFGAGAMVFSPSTYAGQLVAGKPATQALPLFVFSLGVEHAFNERFGIRVQYRDDVYKAPNFKQVVLDAHKLRSTAEPAVGIYYRF